MATKKQPEPTQPKVSKLPLPISDSPLVIDLPDGQKIVVGKMTNGSVIEVATWRGVGRPDSRTSRLMLGVGNGNVDEVPTSEVNASQNRPTSKPKGVALVGYYFEATTKFAKSAIIPFIGKIVSLLASKKNGKKSEVKKSEDVTSPVVTPNSPSISIKPRPEVDLDVQEWLDRISKDAVEKSRKTANTAKSTKKTGTNSSTKRAKTSPKKK